MGFCHRGGKGCGAHIAWGFLAGVVLAWFTGAFAAVTAIAVA